MASSKPNLVWGKRSTVDAEATNVLASLKPGAFESSTNHKAYNLEISGRRVLIQSTTKLNLIAPARPRGGFNNAGRDVGAKMGFPVGFSIFAVLNQNALVR